jgi:hypothetical protein
METNRDVMMARVDAERDRLTKWLASRMTGGKPKAFTKDQYRQLATAQFGTFSKAAFDFAWIAAIETTGRRDWYSPKPRTQEIKQ